MCASVTPKKQCVTCNKSGGILTCDGCQQTFCGKHVTEHRQELAGQLDDIMQEHDLLQQELEEPSTKKNSLLKKIDKWEKDSIVKIQAAAETARIDLQEILEKSKEKLSKACRDITLDLRSSREADDFSEIDLTRWTKQLKELELEIIAPKTVKLVGDKSSPIYLIKVKNSESVNNQSDNSKKPSTSASSGSTDSQDWFLQTLGSVAVEDKSFLAKHVGPASAYSYLRGRFLYSKGCYMVRFKIEKCNKVYRIFLGCMSSQGVLKEDALLSPHAVGWFGSNQVYEHGRCASNCKKYGYHSTMIQNNDELHLILDCDKKQIRLFHERIKTTCTLPVNINLAPFPWQFLMVLCNPDDSVRILPNL